MRYIVSATFLIVGLIHLLPLAGILGSERLAVLYGLSLSEPSLVILMRHRAGLFGLIGAALVYAAFTPSVQPLGFAIGLFSVVSFLYLAWSTGGYNAHLSKVVAADILSVVCLLIGLSAYVFSRNGG